MSLDDDIIEGLALGSVLGGAWVSKSWDRAIRRAMRRVKELRGSCRSPLNVNVIFNVPGEVVTPDFVGLRSGRFSRKVRTLMVEVAVPEGDPKGDPDEEVRHLLNEAIDLAEEFARMEAVIGESDRLDELRAIVAAI